MRLYYDNVLNLNLYKIVCDCYAVKSFMYLTLVIQEAINHDFSLFCFDINEFKYRKYLYLRLMYH